MLCSELMMFENIKTKCKVDVWYDIDVNRKDYSDFVEAIKKFIICWGIAEFRDDTFTKFRLFYRPNKVEEYINQNIERSSSLESIKISKTYKESTLVKKCLKTKDFDPKAFRPSIPVFGPMSEISKRILEREELDKKERLKKSIEEQEKLEKTRKWKSQS